jgi:hypothetical protein
LGEGSCPHIEDWVERNCPHTVKRGVELEARQCPSRGRPFASASRLASTQPSIHRIAGCGPPNYAGLHCWMRIPPIRLCPPTLPPAATNSLLVAATLLPASGPSSAKSPRWKTMPSSSLLSQDSTSITNVSGSKNPSGGGEGERHASWYVVK